MPNSSLFQELKDDYHKKVCFLIFFSWSEILGLFSDKISKLFLFVLAFFALLLFSSSACGELKSEKVSEIRFNNRSSS